MNIINDIISTKNQHTDSPCPTIDLYFRWSHSLNIYHGHSKAVVLGVCFSSTNASYSCGIVVRHSSQVNGKQ